MAQSKPIKKENKDMWDYSDPNSEKEGVGQRGWYKMICDYIYDGESILDVGCSMGRQHFRFIEKNPSKLVGVDASRKALDASKPLSENHHFYHIDDLDKNEKFDVVTSIDVIEHVIEDIDFLETCFSMTKRMMFIATPNLNFSNVGKFHCREYNPQELEILFKTVCPNSQIMYAAWSGLNMLNHNTKRLHFVPTFEGEDKIFGAQLLGVFVWKKG
jgi:2-polyprenyl-3-methyl-5-hydroxy-6-metoxy-1,4-benzoquinol methylase